MGMNIKNDETHRLAQELAALTGESMTEAVTEALRQRLRWVRRHDRGQELREIARDCAARMKEPYRSMDYRDLLYDERGLWK